MSALVKTILCGSYVQGLGRPVSLWAYGLGLASLAFALFCLLAPLGAASGGLFLLVLTLIAAGIVATQPRNFPWFVYDERGALVTREPEARKRK